MKTQNVHLLLGVLLFASLCGAPKKTRIKELSGKPAPVSEGKMPRFFGVMSNARTLKSKAPKSKLSKGKTAKDVAATNIQAVVRGNQVRKGMRPDAASTSVSSRSSSSSPKMSAPRADSKKEQKAATKGRMKDVAVSSAPVTDPTDAFVG